MRRRVGKERTVGEVMRNIILVVLGADADMIGLWRLCCTGDEDGKRNDDDVGNERDRIRRTVDGTNGAECAPPCVPPSVREKRQQRLQRGERGTAGARAAAALVAGGVGEAVWD